MIVALWERFMLAFVALIGAMALFSFGRHVWEAGAARNESPGLIVRSEIRTIYAPKAFIEFAREHPAIATIDESVRLVREARLEAWFGVVIRSYQSNGEVVDIPVAIRPGKDSQGVENTRAVLCLLAGEAAGSLAPDPTDVEIELIEDALMSMEPVEGLRRVLGRGPGRRLADESTPRLVRTGGAADGAASCSGPARESLEGAASHPGSGPCGGPSRTLMGWAWVRTRGSRGIRPR